MHIFLLKTLDLRLKLNFLYIKYLFHSICLLNCLIEILSLQAMPVLLNLMKDPSVIVRDSVAWTLSKICEQVPEAALDGTNLDSLLGALVENLDSEPRVSTNVCWVCCILWMSLCTARARLCIYTYHVLITMC